MWLDKKINPYLWKVRLLAVTLKLTGPYSYISNFYDPKTIGYFAHVTVMCHFCWILMNLS